MKRLAFLLLLLAGPCFAADPLPPVPPPMPAAVNDGPKKTIDPATPPVAFLSAPATAAVGDGILLSPAGSVGDVEMFCASGPAKPKVLILKDDSGATVYGLAVCPAVGVYRFGLVAWGTAATTGRPPHAFAFADVTVGTVPPPVPPTPPTPPTPPAPTDPLGAALQAAYTADAASDKAKSLDFLNAAYGGMAVSVPLTLTTNSAALAWMQTVVQAPTGLKPTQLVGVRRVIAADMATALGTTKTDLLDMIKLTNELQKVQTALAEVH